MDIKIEAVVGASATTLQAVLATIPQQPQHQASAAPKPPVLRQTAEDNYVSVCGFTMQREYGATPNGNPLSGRWVLRKEGQFIDFDQYRSDLAERNNVKIDGTVPSVE